MSTGWDRRFFDSTRGRVVALLRRTGFTVDELARELDLTNNGVRAHLATLERDGIVRQSGVMRREIGGGKPAYLYELVSSKNLNTPFWQSELSASSTTSVLARANLLTSLFSPDELRRMRIPKLSEMGYEQRSRCAIGRYLEDDTGRKVASQ